MQQLRQAWGALQQHAFVAGLYSPAVPEEGVRSHAAALADLPHGAPRMAPIESIHALLDWEPGTLPFDELRRGSVPLPRQASKAEDAVPQRRLLVCHDLGGNYADDAFPQGTANASYYRLNHWSRVDIFVFFSHAFVSIPPPGWINAAHRNGALVLGTFITEWDEGALKCMQLMQSRESAEQAALQLARIAEHYRFDGWLVNIENVLQRGSVHHMVHFIRTLRDLMHARVPGSHVVWYDAVTVDGLLQWQDTLNARNEPFFSAADALFTNYCWRADTPAQAAAAAGPRRCDVFMGTDVFGRNTFGGGGMTCDVALTATRAAGLSAALFAPGWVWQEGRQGDWPAREQAFWDRIEQCWAPPRPAVTALPFVTCFDRGCGERICREGRLVSAQPWFNMSLQGVQPIQQQARARLPTASDALPWLRQGAAADRVQAHPAEPELPEGLTAGAAGAPWLEARVCGEAVWEGGSSLRLQGTLLAAQAPLSIELFTGACLIPPAGLDVVFTACLLSPGAQLELWVWVEASGEHREPAQGSEGAAAAQAAEQPAGQRPWRRFGGMLRAGGAGRRDAATGQQWQTCTYNLPSHLPDYQHLTIRSVEVACSTAGGAAPPAGAMLPCLAYLGQVTLTAADYRPPAVHADGLHVKDVRWRGAAPQPQHGERSDGDGQQVATAAAARQAGGELRADGAGDSSEAAGAVASTGAQETHPHRLIGGRSGLLAGPAAPAPAAQAPQAAGAGIQADGWPDSSGASAQDPRQATAQQQAAALRAGCGQDADRLEPTVSLDATLAWSCSGAGSADVYCRMLGGLAAAGPLSAWTWLGIAGAPAFRVTGLRVAFPAQAVQFAVQRADALGRLEPLTSAAECSLSRP